MQESLFNTVQKLQTEQKVNVEELEILLDSDIEEVVTLCKKACLKPKTDKAGDAYFTKDDVDVLKKIKELYKNAKEIQKASINQEMKPEGNTELNNPDSKVSFLTKAKNRTKNDNLFPMLTNAASFQIKSAMDKMENNLISKMSEILSEKMDGFDEIIVELIRSKTENENLRQQVNTLNKQLYIMKKELASYHPVALNFYIKKDI